ncbi:zinc finger domain-containing protein [Mycolicibacterium wolinskyi]
MEQECPNCHAAPNDWCRRPDWEVRSVPCIARMQLAQGGPA